MRKRKFIAAVSLSLALLTTAAIAFAAVPPVGNYSECTTPGGTLTTRVSLAFQEQKPDKPGLTGYTLTFVLNNGQENIIQAVPAGTVAAPPQLQDKTGYTFDGWFADGKPFDFTQPVQGNAVITAKWTKVDKDPSYNVSGDTSYNISGDTSYTISKDTGSSGGHKGAGKPSIVPTGGSSDKEQPDGLLGQVLNKKDHIQYINGYPDGTVRPENDITRGEVAQIIYRLMLPSFRDSHRSDTNTFSDVDGNVWCNVPISTLANAELLKGYNDGTFGYNRSITRAEFVTIISRFFAVSSSKECPFTDIANHWAKADIEKIASLDYIKGRTSTIFAPDAPITRAEAAAILNRILERGTNVEFMLEDMKAWPDNPTWAWYYEDIQEASNGHDYKAEDGHEVWTSLAGN